jgi:hypothetical protein
MTTARMVARLLPERDQTAEQATRSVVGQRTAQLLAEMALGRVIRDIQSGCAGGGERDYRRAAVGRVRGAQGEAVTLQAVDDLAGRADGDRHALGDVLDPRLARVRSDGVEGLELRKCDSGRRQQVGVEPVPEFDFDAHQFGEHFGETSHELLSLPT